MRALDMLILRVTVYGNSIAQAKARHACESPSQNPTCRVFPDNPMKLARTTILFTAVLAMLLLAAVPSHAQQWNFNNVSYPSATAACQGAVAWYASQHTQPPWNDVQFLYMALIWDPYKQANTGYACYERNTCTQSCNPTYLDQYLTIIPTCSNGLVVDLNTMGGCSPANGVQQGKNIGKTCPGAAKCGDPIDVGSGNVFEEVTDYTTAGQNPLLFTRYYNSRSGALGSSNNNWTTTFTRSIWVASLNFVVEVQRPDGQVLTFTNYSQTGWITDSDVDYTLTQDPNDFTLLTLTTPDDTVETYSIDADYVRGALTSITQRNGLISLF